MSKALNCVPSPTRGEEGRTRWRESVSAGEVVVFAAAVAWCCAGVLAVAVMLALQETCPLPSGEGAKDRDHAPLPLQAGPERATGPPLLLALLPGVWGGAVTVVRTRLEQEARGGDRGGQTNVPPLCV